MSELELVMRIALYVVVCAWLGRAIALLCRIAKALENDDA